MKVATAIPNLYKQSVGKKNRNLTFVFQQRDKQQTNGDSTFDGHFKPWLTSIDCTYFVQMDIPWPLYGQSQTSPNVLLWAGLHGA